MSELGGQIAVDLDRENPGAGFGQREGQRTSTRPDLEKPVVGRWPNGLDEFSYPHRLEEMLAESLARPHSDQTSTGLLT